MPRIWLRLELFELGLLPLPSKYAATLTVANVQKSLDALHARFAAAKGAAVDGDAEMEDAESSAGSPSGFVESDNLNSISFSFWKETVQDIFQWRERDYRAFWLLLLQFHRLIAVKSSYAASSDVVFDEEQCFEREQVPVFKVVIFLFVQTVKPHSWRSKYSLESFNAVWYREHAESLATAASEAPGSKSPRLGAASPSMMARMSPHLGAASPPPPSSPHTVGMQDRSTSDAYYLEFVREKLEDLFKLLYPSVELNSDSQTVISADHMDLLGFLLCYGDSSNMVDQGVKLSGSYLGWKQTGTEGEMSEYAPRVENGAIIARFCKTHLTLNEKLYPPVGFSLTGAALPSTPVLSSVPVLALNDNFSLDGETETVASDKAHAPTVFSQLAKTTVIKRADEFEDEGTGRTDLIIFSCYDSYIYVLGAVRHVMITACKNCKIVMGPSTGILSLDRCENVQLTTIASLARVSNCLESRVNLFTPVRSIMSGENVGVTLGPYNTKCPGLRQILVKCSYQFKPESVGSWNAFLDLDVEKAESMEENDKAPISLQDPAAYREICIPVKPGTAGGPVERPFAIPAEFSASVKAQLETVESLRQLVRSDEFDLQTKRTMEMVIQLRFKDWLSSTGNVRQILDLVQLERANDLAPKDRA